MFEIVILLIAKIEQLLATLNPLVGIAVSEYVTEQGMWAALNMHWANLVLIGGAVGIIMVIVGIVFQDRHRSIEWPFGLVVFGIIIIAIAIITYVCLAPTAQINLIHEATPRLQLLKMIL